MPVKMKVCNTADYNASLKKRGQIFSLLDNAIEVWFYDDVNQLGTSHFVYSDQLIQILALLRYLLKYPFRQLEGMLTEWLSYQHREDLPIPDFSTICRRMMKIHMSIQDHRTDNQRKNNDLVDILIDSTGINIYHTGGGHSKTNQKNRKYKHYDQVRKLHVAMNPADGEILSMHMTEGTVADSEVGAKLITEIPVEIGTVYADKAYDRKSVRHACVLRKAKQKIPPKRNAVVKKSRKKDPEGLWQERNEAIVFIRGYENYDEGFKAWKQENNYGKRSVIEAQFSRLKTIYGFHFMSRSEKSRKNELIIKLKTLNYYNRLGKAKFVRAA